MATASKPTKRKSSPQLTRRGLAAARSSEKHQDQRIMVTGRGRNLAVGKSLPKEWVNVRVTQTQHKDGTISLHIRPLVLTEAIA